MKLTKQQQKGLAKLVGLGKRFDDAVGILLAHVPWLQAHFTSLPQQQLIGAIHDIEAIKPDLLAGMATLQEIAAQAEAVEPPAVEWTVSGDVMRATPPGARIHVEREDEDTARATLRSTLDDGKPPHIADVTVHLPPLSDDLGDEARQICQALYWSWWRAQSTKPHGGSAAETSRTAAEASEVQAVDPRLVFVASPLRGDMERNLAYARAAMFDSLIRDESPYVPHLLYPQVLDDTVEVQRGQGMTAANRWLLRCARLVVYVDLGVSSGMQAEIELADRHGIPVERRRLGGEWEGLWARAAAPPETQHCPVCEHTASVLTAALEDIPGATVMPGTEPGCVVYELKRMARYLGDLQRTNAIHMEQRDKAIKERDEALAQLEDLRRRRDLDAQRIGAILHGNACHMDAWQDENLSPHVVALIKAHGVVETMPPTCPCGRAAGHRGACDPEPGRDDPAVVDAAQNIRRRAGSRSTMTNGRPDAKGYTVEKPGEAEGEAVTMVWRCDICRRKLPPCGTRCHQCACNQRALDEEDAP